MNESLALRLHGVGLELRSENPRFLSYARHYLRDLVVPAVNQAHVKVHLGWGRPIAPATAERLGRRLLLDGPRIVQGEVLALPGLQLGAALTSDGLIIEAGYRFPSYRSRLGYILQGRAGEARLFVTLIYFLVYFPLFWYLERERGWYLLHAAAVAHPRGGILLAGLPGVGKSTFTLALLADPTARLVSDNLVFYDGEQVYAFPEPIHLDRRSRALLPELGERLGAAGQAFSHGRYDYQLAPADRADATHPRVIGILRLAPQTEIRAMSREVCLERLLAYDRLAKEVDEYNKQAAIFGLLSPRAAESRRRLETLERLLTRVDCYEIAVPSGVNLGPVAKQVCRLGGWSNG
ncbi:MAG: hypothetical protein NUW24_12685 [Anaerolineae bacterium]|jgi:hypothetical protein|nr:hypothetical protein [Anaerolineae bacterium]MDH7475154.1 hypothetical protein [Anaerolineae bacterium]